MNTEEFFEHLDEDKIMADYSEMLIQESKNNQEQLVKVLDEVKTMVSTEFYNAIEEFIADEENGIWGDLKLVKKPIGDWQKELNEYTDETYWKTLKGMYVNQSCGYSGDDYTGTLTIKINKTLYLQCSFSL